MPGATPEAVCGTLHFLGLQAVSPSLVLVKVGGSSTPGEREKAPCSAQAHPPYHSPLSTQVSLGRCRAEAISPGPCPNPFWVILPGPEANSAPAGALVIQLPAVLEREVAGLPSDSENCGENTRSNDISCANLPGTLLRV